jgi:hypothetical protein
VEGDKWISKGDKLKQSAVRSILYKFSPLRAQAFVDSLSPSGFGKQLYGIQLHLNNGTIKTLHIKPSKGDSTIFIAESSSYPYVFTLSKSGWESSVLKSRKQLLKKVKSK